MMPELATTLSEVCEYVEDLLRLNQSLLGLEEIYYGDQAKIPVTPVACIEPGEKRSSWKGAQRMARVEFEAYVLVYHNDVRSPQDNRRAADKLAEDIASVISSHAQFEGLVISNLVTSVESGYVDRGSTTMRSSRITFQALSQELLPSTG
jgi:hypothetical protein